MNWIDSATGEPLPFEKLRIVSSVLSGLEPHPSMRDIAVNEGGLHLGMGKCKLDDLVQYLSDRGVPGTVGVPTTRCGKVSRRRMITPAR
jgi:hypothetical protein